MAAVPVTRDFASAQAGDLLDSLAAQMKRVARSPSAVPVHDLRVSIRKFSQALVAFEPCFTSTKKIRRKLKRMMTLAGDVRNLDIAVELTAKLAGEDAGSVVTCLKGRRTAKAEALVSYLKRRTPAEWREKLLPVAHDRAGEFSAAPIGSNTHSILDGFAHTFATKGKRAARQKASAYDLHQFRIAAKKFRYGLALFSPVFGDSLEDSLRQLAGVQKLLGEINDCATVRGIVADCAGSRELRSALKERQQKRTDQFNRLWKAEFAPRELLDARLAAIMAPTAKLT